MMSLLSLLLASSWARPGCGTAARLTDAAFGTSPRRPVAAGSVDSDRFPIRVHHRRAADAERAATVLLPALEEAWEVQIAQLGWPPPPPDAGVGGSEAFDVYLTTEATNGGAWVWGFGPDVIPDDDGFTVPSFMALDEAIPDDQMLSWVAHELNHACQYAIDAREPYTFAWEATAETIAEIVDDDGDFYLEYGAIPDFQAHPFLSLAFDGSSAPVRDHDAWSFYEYGGIVFGLFLEERYGPGTLRGMWDALAPRGEDFLTALDAAVPLQDRAQVYTEFARWRMFTAHRDDGGHFEEASRWGRRSLVTPEAVVPADDLRDFVGVPTEPPYDLGASYYVLDLRGFPSWVRSRDFVVTLEGARDTQWSLVWADWGRGGSRGTGSLGPTDAGALSTTLTLDGEWATIGVVNAGRAEIGDPRDIRRRSFRLSIAHVPDDAVDTDTDDTDVPVEDEGNDLRPPPVDPGCGCDSGPRSLAWVWVLLVLSRRRR
jgi:hypothetical protein